MFRFPVLLFLVISVSDASNSFIEKISSSLIRNGSTYYQYPIDIYSVRIETSENLIDWEYAGVALNTSKSKWSAWFAGTNRTHSLDGNVIDSNNQVRLYFSARHPQTNNFAIGVASSDHLGQETTPQNDPLLSDTNTNFINPGLIYYSNGSLLLTYVDTLSHMHGVILTDDGLQLASTSTVLIKSSSENEQILNQWGLEHGQYLYIFYETGKGGVKVARSTKPLGPYEEMPTPLVANNKDKTTQACLQKLITWGENGWPEV